MGHERARGTHHVDDIVHDIAAAHWVDAHLGLGGFHRHRAFEEVARGTLQNLGKISLQQAIAQARS